MPTTLVAVLSLLVLVLPGFIVAELASSRRASRGGRTDMELVLRALWYALVLHLVVAASSWTVAVYHDLDAPHEWERHVTAIAAYGLVVVVIAPTLLGLGLGAYLRRREQAGRLKAVDYALGASDSRHAWDYVFQHLDAGYVVVHLKDAWARWNGPGRRSRRMAGAGGDRGPALVDEPDPCEPTRPLPAGSASRDPRRAHPRHVLSDARRMDRPGRDRRAVRARARLRQKGASRTQAETAAKRKD